MNAALSILSIFALIGTATCLGNEELASENIQEASVQAKASAKQFKPFTGKITGTRVRLRLAPSLEGTILKELPMNSLCIVVGETDEFYAVKPESSFKGYVFRSFILDGVVEASTLNVRIDPDTGSTVLTQLKQGDHVQGTLCAGNPKWLSIDLPQDVLFYVAKNYVSNLGDETLFTTIQTRRQQVSAHLSTLETTVKDELAKPFAQVKLLPYVNELKMVIAQNQDLPDLVEYAQTLIRTSQEQYLQLSQGNDTPKPVEVIGAPQIALTESTGTSEPTPRFLSFTLENQENQLVDEAIASGRCVNRENFYALDHAKAEELIGQLVPYERPVKNRPGDFMLVNSKSKAPIAYLYSSKIDLNAHVGQNVRLLVSSRPNHHFALPAYFVQDLQVK